MGVILVVTYVSIAVFAISVLVRFVRLSRLPIHVRWELYPVAHEKGRASYGGSYLEEFDWWTKTRESSTAGELKVMIPEIILLAGVWEHNRKHWLRSFPFHFGLYLLIVLIGLLVLGGMATAAGVSISPDGGVVSKAIFHVTYLVGYAGLVLGLLGSLALLARRVFNVDYREYTKPGDYFNLVFFVAAIGLALLAHVVGDPYFASLRTYFAQLVTFGTAAGAEGAQLTGLTAVEIVLGSLLVAYIPLTHMSHFFTKWFMYHHIRWSDEPNIKGGEIERKVNEALQYPVSWSAPHIRGDGKKTWADVATAGVEENDE